MWEDCWDWNIGEERPWKNFLDRTVSGSQGSESGYSAKEEEEEEDKEEEENMLIRFLSSCRVGRTSLDLAYIENFGFHTLNKNK